MSKGDEPIFRFGCQGCNHGRDSLTAAAVVEQVRAHEGCAAVAATFSIEVPRAPVERDGEVPVHLHPGEPAVVMLREQARAEGRRLVSPPSVIDVRERTVIVHAWTVPLDHPQKDPMG